MFQIGYKHFHMWSYKLLFVLAQLNFISASYQLRLKRLQAMLEIIGVKNKRDLLT